MSHRGMSRSSSCSISVAVMALRGLNTEFSLQCADAISNGSYASYLERRPDFSGTCWRTFFPDYIASELLTKFEGFPLGIKRDDVAIGKFHESEERCRATNQRLWRFSRAGDSTPHDVVDVILRSKRKIERILGPFSWDEAESLMDFGPGACIGLTRRHRNSWYKFGFRKPTTTGENAVLADLLIGRSPQWLKTAAPLTGESPGNFSVVRGSRITTVPKDAKSDRVIAIEPMMNMFVQKGIGGMLRHRLKRVGCDLNNQQRNQDLAREGSITGLLATLDLKQASDSIAISLVELLLPDDWVSAMKLCRSKSCILPNGVELLLRKFSSMGNGYTFELESLIFWAITHACADLLNESGLGISIYGDDIICPVGVVELLVQTLEYVGFQTNAKKSFWTGKFRESCGKHYFAGRDVTPFYLKKEVRSQEELLWLANSIRRLSHRLMGFDYGCDSRLEAAYSHVVSKIRPCYAKLSIPDGVGDGGLVRDFDESLPERHRPGKSRQGPYDGFVYQHLVRTYKEYEPGGQPSLVLSLFRLEKAVGPRSYHLHLRGAQISSWWLARAAKLGAQQGYDDGVFPVRLMPDRYTHRVVKSVVPLWADLGPWSSVFSHADPTRA